VCHRERDLSMKTFRHELGNEAGSTVTVQELIECLQKYPADMPVMAEWEGVKAYINPNGFEIMSICKGYKEDMCECLVIDVDGY
jgi:hypothetical protein